jgi:glucose/arabinose dehydrogenase
MREQESAMKIQNLTTIWGVALTVGILWCNAEVGAVPLTTVRVASGLNSPVFVTAPPGDTTRLFILEQNTALIRILQNGQILTTPFLNLSPRVGSSGYEQGLLGMAFHPDYAANGYFYVNYTDLAGNTVIARYQVTGNPNIADFNSEFIILTIPQPYSNHNGGMLAFAPDGTLYIGTGDGGSGFDPQNRAQNGLSLLGKMLRIDVDGASPYAVPADNPFVGNTQMLGEIWAIGLRNPWRFSFDRATGDLYIGDVGQNLWEEVDFQAAGAGGRNYGWRVYEGNHATGLSGLSGVVPSVTFPVYEFPHQGGACSVTGGYVYRGAAIPDLAGTYFFADFCSNQIWSFRYINGGITQFQERTSELAPGGGLSITSISSFGEDARGELYIADLNGGEIFKIVAAQPDVQMDLIPQNPPILIPAVGGTFFYDAVLTNNSQNPRVFDVWIDVVLPSSHVFGPLLLRTGLQLPGGAVVPRSNLAQSVPGGAPSGIYTYRGHAGNYPDETWSLDSFTFEKSGSDASGLTDGGWNLTGCIGEDDAAQDPKQETQDVRLTVQPNPFNARAVLAYELAKEAMVELNIYNIQGRQVAESPLQRQNPGLHRFVFEGGELPSGVYYYLLQVDATSIAGKMVLLK